MFFRESKIYKELFIYENVTSYNYKINTVINKLLTL